jgi:hypothetical protein
MFRMRVTCLADASRRATAACVPAWPRCLTGLGSAAALTAGGLTVAVTSDPETAERLGFRAGLKAGSLRRRWRSVFGRRGKDRP